MEITFNEWITDQQYRDDTIGDLAKDIADDPDFPGIESWDDLDRYFSWKGFPGRIHEDVMQTVECAWDEYKTCLQKK